MVDSLNRLVDSLHRSGALHLHIVVDSLYRVVDSHYRVLDSLYGVVDTIYRVVDSLYCGGLPL